MVGKLACSVDKLGSTNCLLNKLILFTKRMHQLGLIFKKKTGSTNPLPPTQSFLGELLFRPSPQTPAQPRTIFLPHCFIYVGSDQSTVVKESVDRLNMTHKLTLV